MTESLNWTEMNWRKKKSHIWLQFAIHCKNQSKLIHIKMGKGTVCLGFDKLWDGGEEFPQLDFSKEAISETSLVAQWLRLYVPNTEGLSSIPSQGTRSYIPQLRVHMLQLKISHNATKTQNSQINKCQGDILSDYKTMQKSSSMLWSFMRNINSLGA